MILTIDPGLRGCGCAIWTSSGELVKAQFVSGLEDKVAGIERVVREMAWSVEEWTCRSPFEDVSQMVVERPQTYRGRAARGDANDLLDVSLVVGALSVMSQCPLLLVRPSEWKGQTPKHATEARARKVVPLDRVDLTCGKTFASNVWDAVGIGLWYFRRQSNR